MTTNPRIAAVYCRVSSARQGDESKVSLADQQRRCLEAARAEGFEVLPEMVFVDRVSGTKGEDERPGFGTMMDAARSGKFSKVFFWRVDRLGRDQVEIGVALRDLERAGVEFRSLDDPDLANRLLRGITAAIADHEAAMIRARTARGRKAAREHGVWTQGMAPFGHRRRDDGALEIDPVEAATVRRVVAWIRDGLGRVAVVSRLNRERVLPPLIELTMPGRARMVRMRSNDPCIHSDRQRLAAFMADTGAEFAKGREPCWGESTIDRMVHNSVLHGETGGIPVKIVPAPLLTVQEHRELLEIVAGRHRKGKAPRNSYLLTGRVICGTCGRGCTVHIGGANRNGPVTLYWICAGRRNGSGCTQPLARMDAVNPMVATKISSYLTKRLSRQSFRDFLAEHSRSSLAEIERRHTEIRVALADATKRRAHISGIMMRMADMDEAALADFKAELSKAGAKVAELETEERDLLARLARVQEAALTDDAAHQDVAFLAEHGLWLDGDMPTDPALPDPRDILAALNVRVTVQPDRQAVVTFDDTDAALADVVRVLAGWAQRAYQRTGPLKRFFDMRHISTEEAFLSDSYEDPLGVVGSVDTDKPLA